MIPVSRHAHNLLDESAREDILGVHLEPLAVHAAEVEQWLADREFGASLESFSVRVKEVR